MAIEFVVDMSSVDGCAICAAADAYTGIMKSYATEFFKVSAGYGMGVVTGVLTLTWIWQLAKGLWSQEGYDKHLLIETTLWCIVVGSLMTEPESLLNAFFWFFSAGIDMAAKGFQAAGGGPVDTSGMSGLLKSTEMAFRSQFGPLIKSLLKEVGISNLVPLLVLLVLVLPVVWLLKQLLVHLISPAFVLFGLACSLYFLMILGIFPQTRRVPGNALRIAAAVSMQTMYAGIVVSFVLAIISALMKAAAGASMAAFDIGFMVVVFTVVFMAISIGPMMAIPAMLFDVIQQNPNTRLWQLKK